MIKPYPPKFNKFETDEQTIKDLQDYIFNLQKINII